jgi:hypothetical protein
MKLVSVETKTELNCLTSVVQKMTSSLQLKKFNRITFGNCSIIFSQRIGRAVVDVGDGRRVSWKNGVVRFGRNVFGARDGRFKWNF